jgi:hypothetical protein
MSSLARATANITATLVIALCITRILGSIPFAPWATAALIRLAAWFGAHGDEQVEAFYALVSLSGALMVAIAFVWVANRLLFRWRT